MKTEVVQTRLPVKMVKFMDSLIKKGFYANKSDLIRDAIRDMLLEDMIGIIPDNGVDSVKEVKEIRKKLSKEKFDLDEINKLAD